MKHFSRSTLLLLPLRVLAGSRLGNAHLNGRYNYLEELPGCAYNCVVQFSSVSFPFCESSDLDCLCTSQSKTGFTLGEGAVKCLASDCPGASAYLLNAAYALCANVHGAQPETHATLEASMATAATILVTPVPATTTNSQPAMTTETSSPTRSVRRTATSMHTSFKSKSTSKSTTESVVLFTSTFPTHPFPTPTTSNVAATTTSSGSDNVNSSAANDGGATTRTVLTQAQIAGIVVASVLISAIMLGLLFCVFRSKRLRSRRRRDSDASFGEKGQYAAQSNTPRLASQGEDGDNQLGAAPKARQFLGIPANPAQKRWTLWRKAMKDNSHDVEAQNTVVAEEAPIERSPASVQSYHTTSRLLPDKPQAQFKNFQWQSSPSRLRPEQYRPRPRIAEESPKQPVRFANEVGLRLITPTPPPSQPSSSSGSWQEQNTSQSALQNQPLRHQLSDPFIDKNASAVAPLASTRRASNKDLPRIITPDAVPYPHPQRMQHQQAQRYPIQQQQRYPVVPQPSYAQNQAMTSYVSPRYYESPGASTAPSWNTRHQQQRPQEPTESSSEQFSKWRPLRRTSRSLRPMTHYTAGSDTSFEDDGEEGRDDVMVSTLSPVAESPARYRNNGVSSVYYPPVPGSTPSAKRLQVTPQRELTRPAPGQNTTPCELPDSSPDASKHTSPNFSRPQQLPRQQLTYENAPPKWHVLSSPGLDGVQETWSSPIPPLQPTSHHDVRPAIVQIRPDNRGPWRGRTAPIGSQWHHENIQRR